MTLLVTGADGFVGRHLCRLLERRGHDVRRAVRRASGEGGGRVQVGEIGPATQWDAALRGVDTVVHLAARVHVMHETASDPAAEYRRVNVEGTAALGEAAARNGVRRIVLVSTVKVHGEATAAAGRFREDDVPAPRDPYAASKRQAERILQENSAFETVVIRPPLVYGPGVGANFLRLLRSVDRGLPLPLGSVRNARSLVYVGNLCDSVRECCTHPSAAQRTFLVSDGEPLSTPALVRAVAAALGRAPRLLPVPPSVLRAGARALGRGAAAERLLSSLAIDSTSITRVLGWVPPYSLEQGLKETVEWYRQNS